MTFRWRADGGPTLNAGLLSRLFIAALWSSEGKRMTSWLLFVMLSIVIVSIPDPCCLSYFCFQRIRTSFAKKSYIFVIFQGRGPDPYPPSGSAHE